MASSKRPRREAAVAATDCLADASGLVAEVEGCHATKTIALTSQDVLESAAERDTIFRGTHTTLVSLFTDDRPKGMPRGTTFIGAAFDDSASFVDAALTEHLDRMAAAIETAATPRIVFVCQAGVNRSSLALCYYCGKHGGVCWQQAKTALVLAKGSAAAGWPTLENRAFEAFLARRFGAAATAPPPVPTVATQPVAPTVTIAGNARWFWRTVATNRPSTGGPGTDPAMAAAKQREWEAGLRRQGIDPKIGRTYGCWADGRAGGRWIRGVPGKKRPWGGDR